MNRRAIVVGTGWSALFNTVNRAVFPVLGIVIARLLGAEAMGAFSVLAMSFAVADVLRDAGIGASYVADPHAEKRERAYLALSVWVGSVLGLAVAIVAPILAGLFPSFPNLTLEFRVVGLAIALNGLGTIPAARLQRQARFKDVGRAELTANVVSYGVAFALIALGWGFGALVAQMLVRVGWFAGHCLALAPESAGPQEHESPWVLARNTLPVLGNNALYSVYTMADNLLIARWFGPAGAGWYSVAYNLAVKPLEFVSFPLGRTLYVAFCRTADDRRALGRRFTKALSVAALFATPVYGCLVVFGPELIALLYGPEFAGGGALLQILAVYLFVRAFGTLAGSALLALQRAAVANLWWVLGFGVALTGLMVQRAEGSLSLQAATWWITAGALAAYLGSIASVIALARPQAGELLRVLGALGVGAPSIATLVLASILPLPDAARVLAGVAAAAIVHTMAVGWRYGGDLRACWTVAGWRRMARVDEV